MKIYWLKAVGYLAVQKSLLLGPRVSNVKRLRDSYFLSCVVYWLLIVFVRCYPYIFKIKGMSCAAFGLLAAGVLLF